MWLLPLACLAEDRPMVWVPPVDWPPTLRDIAGRLPKNTPAYEPCPVTYGHEGSHFLSKGAEGHHGIYVGEGRLRYVPIPPLRTEAVFANVPPERRGPIYETYLRQGRSEYWRDKPVMILDEWVAYLRGSQIRRELGWEKRQETDRYCAVMADYSAVMHRMAMDIPDYDCSVLTLFCRDIANECRATIPEWDQLTDARFE